MIFSIGILLRLAALLLQIFPQRLQVFELVVYHIC